MTGYKASYNGKCLNFQYEIGQTYELEGELEMCRNGFHFCDKPDDVFDYYNCNANFVLFEVEALGEVISKGNKSVTSKIKIVREIPRTEWKDVLKSYDFENNHFHYIDSDGDEFWIEYDENNNLIHFKNSNGYEYWKEYDENGNLIHYRDSDGFKYWQEYDKNGKEINYKDSTGIKF